MSLLSRTGAMVSGLVGRNNPLIRRLRPSYETLLDLSTGGRGVEWAVNGEPLRIDPHVRRLVARTTEPELWEYLRANVGRGERALDIGAFLGIYAVLVARWSGPDARVLAFEPTPSVFPTLQRHVRLNKMEDRVTTINEAVGAEAGFVELHEHSDPYRNAVGVTDPAGVSSGTTKVPLTTLDAACEARGFSPTFLRMDVQGFEFDVLRGARKTIANGRGKLRMVLEAHPQLWPLQGRSEKEFDALLEELSLRPVPLRKGGPRYEPDGHIALEYV